MDVKQLFKADTRFQITNPLGKTFTYRTHTSDVLKTLDGMIVLIEREGKQKEQSIGVIDMRDKLFFTTRLSLDKDAIESQTGRLVVSYLLNDKKIPDGYEVELLPDS